MSACGRAARITEAIAPPSNILGARTSSDPQTAVEGYLQQYQPGPIPRLFQTTHIYDRNGLLLAELSEEGQRTWVKFDQISPALIDATVATEDASFFANNGVDPVRIMTAILRNAKKQQVTSGASTITMQLARNLFLGADQRYDQSLDRKLYEVGLAQELTQLYSKNELLEMYLNLLNYGNATYGPEAASQRYFGKSAHDLTLAEATLLAGIPQQPANLNPFQNFAAVKQRQRTVLDLMVRHGKLDQAAADVLFAEKIVLRQANDSTNLNLAPHFVQYVIETLDARLGQGYTRRAGLNIRTTLDLKLQTLAQQIVTQSVAELRPQYDLSNAALVAMRPNSGEILAMVGSADFYNDAISGQVNVTVSLRQPGSAIKPVLYATAISDTVVSPATVIWDVPVSYAAGAGQRYEPHNYDNKFHGPVTVRTALANSYNVPTVKLLDALGIARMLESAKAMGIHSLNQGRAFYGLSLTLGGGDVTLLDLTTAYHTLASQGQYWPANPILSMTTSQNQLIKQGAPVQPTSVVDPAAAFLVTDILSDNTARTPAFGASSPLKLSRPAAVKTGTTTDFRDNWTIGYTRYLVTGVWAGNSDGHPMQHTSGVTGAAPIWHNFMEAVLRDPALLALLNAPADESAWQFTVPPGVEQRPDCPPNVICRTNGEYFTTRWLQANGEAGPLADSVEIIPNVPVYVQQGEQTRRVGFCTFDQAAPHLALKLPRGVGLSDRLRSTGVLTETSQVTQTVSMTETAFADKVTQEQRQVMAWSLRYASSVNLGPCDHLNNAATQALALNPQASDNGLRMLIDWAAAGNPDVASVPTGGAKDVALVNQNTALTVPTDLQAGTYRLVLPVINDANCPGTYIMGRIVNRANAPVAGVHVHLRDEWGNQADAISKNGASDYGSFDFPLASDAPHQIYLTVIDGAGRLVSPTFTIQHKQGTAGDAPCHHVILQGG
ncbi:MAG: transglycosylase domain-containing protein [Chloroflexi bacterium]|nr:transglycosylase domain-containing protein [Chloroflexota bacterium]